MRRDELVELPEVKLERDDGPPLYEIEMLGPQGQVVKFEFDAGDGELIGMEGMNINAMRKAAGLGWPSSTTWSPCMMAPWHSNTPTWAAWRSGSGCPIAPGECSEPVA
ncbi:PepSY domain-containing protein [Halomonas elongata]|uniref:PepSY domain-containing protein n=1 Tax=Halomonas elongata TaxID=2746 RepID=UPI003D18810B